MLWEFSGPNMEVKRDSGLKDLLGTEIAVWSDSRGEEGLRGCTDCGRNRGISLVWQQRRDQGKQRIWERLSGHAHLTRVWCVFLHLCAWLAFFICILPAAPLESALARKRHSHTLYNPVFWMPSYFGTLSCCSRLCEPEWPATRPSSFAQCQVLQASITPEPSFGAKYSSSSCFCHTSQHKPSPASWALCHSLHWAVFRVDNLTIQSLSKVGGQNLCWWEFLWIYFKKKGRCLSCMVYGRSHLRLH